MRPKALPAARREASRLVAQPLRRGVGMVDCVPVLPDAAV